MELFRPTDRDAAREKIGLKRHKPYVLFPNTPGERRKRLDLAEAAIAVTRETYRDLELLVLDGESQRVVPLYMSACDAMLLTSDWEGSPNVVKEAMACNLPVVSVDAGDAWQVIEGARHCHRAERAAGDLADKLVRVLTAGERSDGRERIGHLALGAVAKRVIDVYQTVLQKG
jgi:hypothetical protein